MQFINKLHTNKKCLIYIYGVLFMIIIQKKRLMYLSLIVFVSIFVCGMTVNRTENTVQTAAIPVSNKVIVIDAGHGVPDEGDCLLTLINNN